MLFHEYHDKDEGDFYGKHKVYDEFVREARKNPDLREKMVAGGLDKCVEPAWKRRKIAKLPRLPGPNSINGRNLADVRLNSGFGMEDGAKSMCTVSYLHLILPLRLRPETPSVDNF